MRGCRRGFLTRPARGEQRRGSWTCTALQKPRVHHFREMPVTKTKYRTAKGKRQRLQMMGKI